MPVLDNKQMPIRSIVFFERHWFAIYSELYYFSPVFVNMAKLFRKLKLKFVLRQQKNAPQSRGAFAFMMLHG